MSDEENMPLKIAKNILDKKCRVLQSQLDAMKKDNDRLQSVADIFRISANPQNELNEGKYMISK